MIVEELTMRDGLGCPVHQAREDCVYQIDSVF